MAKVKERTPYGERLRAARLRADLTQEQLSKRVGISQSTLNELESKGQGSMYTAQLAYALGVRALWLASGEGGMEDRQRFSDEATELAMKLDAMGEKQRQWMLDQIQWAFESWERAAARNGQDVAPPDYGEAPKRVQSG